MTSNEPVMISVTLPPLKIHLATSMGDLILRPVCPADTRLMARVTNECIQEFREFLSWAHYPQTEESQYKRLTEAQRGYWAGSDYSMALFDSSEKNLLGSLALHKRSLNPRSLEIGYWVNSKFTGQGLATLGTKALTVLAFEMFHAQRVQINHNENNQASRRVIEKCGYKHEATHRFAEPSGTPEMTKNGYACGESSLMHVLFYDDLDRLEWYEDMKKKMTFFNYLGEEIKR